MRKSSVGDAAPVGLVAGAFAACLVLGCIGEIDGARRGLSATGGAPGNPSGGDRPPAGGGVPVGTPPPVDPRGAPSTPPRPSTNPIPAA